jgi:hypothetical protein
VTDDGELNCAEVPLGDGLIEGVAWDQGATALQIGADDEMPETGTVIGRGWRGVRSAEWAGQ